MTCKCDLRTRAVGDGCKYCNPQEYIDRLEEQTAEDKAEIESMQAEIERLKWQLDGRDKRIADLLAVIKAKDEALKFVHELFASEMVENALQLKTGDVELINSCNVEEYGWNGQGITYVNGHHVLNHGTKLYTIKTKE